MILSKISQNYQTVLEDSVKFNKIKKLFCQVQNLLNICKNSSKKNFSISLNELCNNIWNSMNFPKIL